MTTPIYLPPTPSVGEALGHGIGNAFQTYVAEKDKQDKLKKAQAFETAISTAGSREKALELHAKFPYDNIAESAAGLSVVNQFYPPKDTTVHEVTAYDPKTGKPIKAFAQGADLTKMNTPEGRKQFFGSSDVSMAQPVTHEYFKVDPKDPAAIMPLGTFPEGQQPPNSVSKSEIDVLHGMQALSLQAQQANRDQKKLQTDIEKAAREGDAARMAQLKTFNGLLLNTLNVKKSLGVNGEISLDFSADPKAARAYSWGLDHAEELMKEFKGDVGKAAVAVKQRSGAYDEPPPDTTGAPTAPAAQSSPLMADLKRMIFGDKKAAPTAAPAAKPTAPSPQQKEAPAAAISYLKSHNNTATRKAFKEKYGYLPKSL